MTPPLGAAGDTGEVTDEDASLGTDTFCHPPLRHGQCDQLTNHILPSSPPTRSVRLTHQSHSVILPSDTVSAINSPITFCHPPLRHGLSSSPPTRSVRSTHQSNSLILPSDTVSAINHQSHSVILPSDTVSAINSPITFSHPPLRHGHDSPITFSHPPLRHGQCDLTNHILSSSPPTRSVRSTHQSHSSILPSDTVSAILTNHILPSSPPTRSVRIPITFILPSDTVSAIHQSHSAILPSDTVSAISPITFCHPPLRHGQCDQHQSHSVILPSDTVSAIHQSHSLILPSDTVSAISPITFSTRSVRSIHQSHSVILPSDTVSAINSPITFCGQCIVTALSRWSHSLSVNHVNIFRVSGYDLQL